MIEKITTFACELCGSTHCGQDATARHDPATGEWIVGSIYDGTWCNDCGEVDLVEVELVGEDADEVMAERAEHAVKTHAKELLVALEELMDDLKSLSREYPICSGILKSSYGTKAQAAINAARTIPTA